MGGAELVPGVWLGEWILERVLGAGGFAEVWEARHGTRGDVAAVKVPTTPAFAAHLRAERRRLDLHHPSVVRLLEDHLDADPPFLVLELVPGGNLRAAASGPQPPERAARIVTDVAAALDHAHAHGALHLDVKPENVLVDPARERYLLTDFGAGAAPDGGDLAQSLDLSAELGRVGTRDYAAPELRRGDRALDRRADVYSLGVLAYELLTGRLPLGLDRPSQLVAGLPPAVDDVVARALADDPQRRPLSAGAFAAALRAALDAAPAARAAAGGSSAPPGRRRRTGLLLGLALALAGAAAASAWWRERPAPEHAPGPLAALLDPLPAGSSLGLLPVEDLGLPGDGPRGRALRASLDRGFAGRELRTWYFQGSHPDLAPGALFDAGAREELVRASGCRRALHAVVPADARVPDRDALLFLVDLPTWRIVAASPPRSEAARALARELAAALGQPGAPLAGARPVVAVLPTVDAARGVSNAATAAFDAELTAGLVAAVGERASVQARAGIVERLRSAGEDLRAGLGADVALACELDVARGVVAARLRDLLTGHVLAAAEAAVSPPGGYDAARGAARFTVDPAALERFGAHVERELARATERACAHLFRGEPEQAASLLEALRTRDPVYAGRAEPLLLLARAYLDQGRLERALACYEEALGLAPDDPRVHEDYGRACVDAAGRLFAAGKAPWYGDDDEERFEEARRLLGRLEPLALPPPLAREAEDLRRRLEDEL